MARRGGADEQNTPEDEEEAKAPPAGHDPFHPPTPTNMVGVWVWLLLVT